MMVTIPSRSVGLEVSSASPHASYFWRSLPTHMAPAVIYQDGWSTRDADEITSNDSGSTSSVEEVIKVPPKSPYKVFPSIRVRRNAKNEPISNNYDNEGNSLVTRPTKHLTKTQKTPRCRSASTPTLCCCSSEPDRRCSQPTAQRTPVRNHFQALARALKRSVTSARKKTKSASVGAESCVFKSSVQISTSAQHLRSLASGSEELPRLGVVLRDERAHQAFKDFLKREYSDENINFWTDVEQYKKLKDRKDRMKMADQIFCTYLQTEAVYEINISYETKTETFNSMKQLKDSTFNRAQNEILFLMESDAFKRFLCSVMSS